MNEVGRISCIVTWQWFQGMPLGPKIPDRWATGWKIGVLVFYSRRELGIFLFTPTSKTALGPTQPPIQWVPGG